MSCEIFTVKCLGINTIVVRQSLQEKSPKLMHQKYKTIFLVFRFFRTFDTSKLWQFKIVSLGFCDGTKTINGQRVLNCLTRVTIASRLSILYTRWMFTFRAEFISHHYNGSIQFISKCKIIYELSWDFIISISFFVLFSRDCTLLFWFDSLNTKYFTGATIAFCKCKHQHRFVQKKKE